MIFGTNNNVEMQLAPAYENHKSNSSLNPLHFTKFLTCCQYICHVRGQSLDFYDLQFCDKKDFWNGAGLNENFMFHFVFFKTM